MTVARIRYRAGTRALTDRPNVASVTRGSPAGSRETRPLGPQDTQVVEILETNLDRANHADRCYFCKSEALGTLARAARLHGYTRIATGLTRTTRPTLTARAIITDAGVPVTDLRVRDLGAVARVEVSASDLPAVRAVPGLTEAIGQAGFADLPAEYASSTSGILNEENIDDR
jgi:hypothetical protein